MNTIAYATPGNCYEDCLHLLCEHPTWILVHGFPCLADGPDKGKRYGHAWMEYELMGITWCLDHLHQDMPIPAALFYHVGKINPLHCAYYRAQDVFELMETMGVSSPWVEMKGILYAS